MDKWVEVSAIMSKDYITADPADTLEVIREKLADSATHHVPLVKDGKIVGIISKGDLLRMEHHFTIFNAQKSLEHNKAIFSTVLASEIMTKNMVMLKTTDTISTAVDLFRENLFHALPVVDESEHLVGMITPLDLLRYAFDNV